MSALKAQITYISIDDLQNSILATTEDGNIYVMYALSDLGTKCKTWLASYIKISGILQDIFLKLSIKDFCNSFTEKLKIVNINQIIDDLIMFIYK